ncbi:hypothetical protein NKH18_43730 [Streptomyces sp. M10(2022)]
MDITFRRDPPVSERHRDFVCRFRMVARTQLRQVAGRREHSGRLPERLRFPDLLSQLGRARSEAKNRGEGVMWVIEPITVLPPTASSEVPAPPGPISAADCEVPESVSSRPAPAGRVQVDRAVHYSGRERPALRAHLDLTGHQHARHTWSATDPPLHLGDEYPQFAGNGGQHAVVVGPHQVTQQVLEADPPCLVLRFANPVQRVAVAVCEGCELGRGLVQPMQSAILPARHARTPSRQPHE